MENANAIGNATRDSESQTLMRERVHELRSEDLTVKDWTEHFLARSRREVIFKNIDPQRRRSRRIAVAMGANWFRFSSWLPGFLSLSTAKLSDNLIRHYLIQIAFEELGGRKNDEIHCRLLEEVLAEIGISRSEMDQVNCEVQEQLCDRFYGALVMANTDAEILGLNLGMEIIAEENIETLFSILAYSNEAADSLERSLYFKEHRAIEENHLRISVSNFLRFCDTDRDKARFINSFDSSIELWVSFWDGVNGFGSQEPVAS